MAQAKVGKIDQYILGVVGGAIRIQGNWNANTNTPDITGATTTGFAWIVSVAGDTTLGSINVWDIGDIAVKTDNGWAKIANREPEWGNITGDISDKKDLQEEFDTKIDTPEIYNLDTEILTLPISYVHSFIKVGKYLFCGSRSNPGVIVRINDCQNMNAGGIEQIQLTGSKYAEAVTYMNGKLYFLH